ncbi:MAG TPA: AAA family ATPase, partial [Ktedonobacteraceae bacterium]|nr:AAA family ATPase [Ktedonobacteraceae bacterium]
MQALPVVQFDTLVSCQHGQDRTLTVGTPEWYAWLDSVTSFIYTSDRRSFVARKERAGNRRGGWYWRAYGNYAGKTYRAYLGKSQELTLERLSTVMAWMASQEMASREERMPQGGCSLDDASASHHNASSVGVAPVFSEVTAELENAGKAGQASTIQNLPLHLTPLIGREQEVLTVCDLLRGSKTRLLTLTGPGGVGKTHLALHIAAALKQDFADGVCFVPLADLRHPSALFPTIACTLGREHVGEQCALADLKRVLHHKHLLLLLDSFEPVVQAAPALAALLESCFNLSIVVTSREVLHVRYEHALTLPPLPLPNLEQRIDPETLSPVPSVALLLERAHLVAPDLHLTETNAPAFAEICHRLDGLPLSIEFAAVHLKLLTPDMLLARLEQRLPLLTSRDRDRPFRHQTLRNTFQWSYDLLTETEQRNFRLLSLFPGGCTLEAIEAISASLDGVKRDVVNGVISLLDKSLLQQTKQRNGEPRLFLLESMREYGLECLTSSGEEAETRLAHAHYYARQAEEMEICPFGVDQERWFERLEPELANLRAAFRWSREQGGAGHALSLRLASVLVRFWTFPGYQSEEQQFLEEELR